MNNNEIKISLNNHLSGQHLRYAILQTIEASKIESEIQLNKLSFDEKSITGRGLYYANLTSSIFLISAFLESQINELFADASNGEISPENDKESRLISNLKESWLNNIPRTGKYTILEKYQTAIEIGIGEKLDKGSKICQDIDFLIRLRNALIHHESEIVTTTISGNKGTSSQTIEKSFCNRYKMNPFVAIGNPFFPDKCISFGCACWGIVRAVDFTKMFFEKIGLNKYPDETLNIIKKEYGVIEELHKQNENSRFQYTLRNNAISGKRN